ncbi:cytochrome P450 87A3-like [Sesamum indicum]|uniref:Cytochrome P450 87A3-like n=1 Tax=Sesamum indicum TaxID=4182 RepID=A0A6I9U2W2_SESIN|nr:cytochrome P450 87A3-like [Sesamum indicum]
MAILLLYVVVPLVVAVSLWVYRWRNPKCNGVLPPGSMGLPLIGETFEYFSAQPLEGIPPFIAKRMARYGPVFRTSLVGQPVVMSTDQEVNQYIFGQEGKMFQAWYTQSGFRITGEKGLPVHAGNSHKYLRNLIRDIVGLENLKEELVHEMDRITSKHLSRWAHSHEVDVKDAAEIMVVELGGKKFLGLEEGKALELRENYKNFKDALISFPLNVPGTAFHEAMQGRERAIKMIRSALDARRSSNGNHDFLDQIMREVEDEDTILTREVATDVLFLLLFASFETTSTTIALALHFLHRHPNVLQHLKEEHEKILSGRDNKETRGITWTEYKSMTFTHMVINETVRLADNVPGMFRKVMQEVKIKGYTIPAGWTVVVCPCATHLNPNEYEDPYLFNPWRWQGQELHAASKKFLAFGGGRRLCAGADFAKLQIAIFIHYLVTQYRWKITKEGVIVRKPGLAFPKALCVQLREARRD